jgi:hypothetical protein
MKNPFKLQIFSYLLCIIAIGSCNPLKLVPTDDYIQIGHGGGFSGQEMHYTIYTNGHVKQEDTLKCRLKQEDTDQIFKNIKVLDLDNLNWNKPGNLYKFIEYSINNKTHKVVWDTNASDYDEKLNLFYNHVSHLIQNSNR